MPLQNRVAPNGSLIFTSARGTFMGNRGGALHNERQEIVRQFVGHRWLICILEFKNRRRQVMSPGLYTELFFLDEAVALAAGHRPCAECRPERFKAFVASWKESVSRDRAAVLRAPEIDRGLHHARIGSRREKITYQAPLESLPDGCFVQIAEASYLVWKKALLLWSAEGYVKKELQPAGVTATVLTPEPTVRCLRGGYEAEIHRSAFVLSC
jgi:hypothetical protein